MAAVEQQDHRARGHHDAGPGSQQRRGGHRAHDEHLPGDHAPADKVGAAAPLPNKAHSEERTDTGPSLHKRKAADSARNTHSSGATSNGTTPSK